MKNAILIFFILITTLLNTSCVKRVSLSNMDVQMLNKKAEQLLQEGDFEGAIGRLESINDLNPNLAENHYNLGIAYYKTNQYEKAVNSLQKAVDLNKNSGSKSSTLALLIKKQGNFELYGLRDAYYTLSVIHEELAVKNTEELEEIKSDKEKKLNALIQIGENYQKARNNYESYMSFVPPNEELSKKLDEFNIKLEKNSKELSGLGFKKIKSN